MKTECKQTRGLPFFRSTLILQLSPVMRYPSIPSSSALSPKLHCQSCILTLRFATSRSTNAKMDSSSNSSFSDSSPFLMMYVLSPSPLVESLSSFFKLWPSFLIYQFLSSPQAIQSPNFFPSYHRNSHIKPETSILRKICLQVWFLAEIWKLGWYRVSWTD